MRGNRVVLINILRRFACPIVDIFECDSKIILIIGSGNVVGERPMKTVPAVVFGTCSDQVFHGVYVVCGDCKFKSMSQGAGIEEGGSDGSSRLKLHRVHRAVSGWGTTMLAVSTIT